MRELTNIKSLYVNCLFLLCFFSMLSVLQSTTRAQAYWGENIVKERSWNTDNLKGKVARMESQVEWIATDVKTKSYYVVEYDRFGKLIYEDQKSEQSGIQSLKNLYIRDEHGNLLQKKTEWGDGSEIITFQAKYDLKSRVMEYFTNSPEQHQVLKQIINYGSFGRSKLDVFEVPGNLLSYSVSYSYSLKGVLQEISHFNRNLELRWKENFYYSDNYQRQEHIISECDKNECKKISKQVEFKKGDRVIKRVGFEDADIQDFRYWRNGTFSKIITTTHNISETILKVEKYDNLGNLILRTEKGTKESPSSIIRYKYRFDKNRNWVEKSDLNCKGFGNKEKCNLSVITKRNLIYFEN